MVPVKRNLKILSIVLGIFSTLLFTTACKPLSSAAPPSTESTTTRTVVDSFGRTVEIPESPQRIACTGTGALRIVSYLGCTDKLVGVEDTDKSYKDSPLRDYAYVNHEFLSELPSIGKGGGSGNTAYVEELVSLQPDVILSGYNEEALNELAQITGIPCVSIRYLSINFVDESFYTAMNVAAEVLGAQDRCTQLLEFIDGCKQDLRARTSDIPLSDKLSCYTGAVTFSGSHGFTGTYSNFGPFLGIAAHNVADSVGNEGYFDADPEQIIVWDPDLIFLDPGNISLVLDEYEKNPDFFLSLRAFREGQVYAQISFNNYSTNVGYALANSYYAGIVMFPEQFADVDIEEKTNEILNVLLGEKYYDKMASAGLSFGVINFGSEK